MTDPAAPTLYRYYLAADLAEKRLAAVGASTDSITLDRDPAFRGSTSVDDDGVPFAHKWPEIRVVAKFPQPSTHSYDMLTSDERERTRQGAREAALLDFVARFPDTSVYRQYGNAYAYFEALEGIGVTIDFGQALCELVQTGVKMVEKVDPEYLAAAPKIQVTEPVFEWRCNDAELRVL